MSNIARANLRTDDGYEVSFRFSRVEDSFTRAIALYDIPYADGALSDDLGAESRKITFAAIFRGDAYPQHLEFIDKLRNYNKLWTLTHPQYGIISGRIRSASVDHSKSAEHCAVSIEFIETIDAEPAAQPITHAEKEAENFAIGICRVTKDDLAERVDDVQNPPDSSWLGALSERTAQLEATASAIASPANSIAAKIKTASSIPGRMAGAVVNVVEAYVAAAESITSTPQMISSVAFAIDQATNSILSILAIPTTLERKFRAAINAMYASITGAYLARRLQADNDARRALLIAELVDSWTPEGDYIPPRDFDSSGGSGSASGDGSNGSSSGSDDGAEFLSAPALQDVFFAQTELVNNAKRLARENDLDPAICRLLSAQTRTLSAFINDMMLKTGYVRAVTLPLEMPLFLLLHREGLSYKAANRVHALNPRIKNPTFYSGEVKIYDA